MQNPNIANLLGNTYDKILKFITKKWIEGHDQSGNADDKYKPKKQIRFKTSMLQSDQCNYSDIYIVAKETVTGTDPNDANYDKKLAFQNNVPFINCILKINNTLIDNAEDLDIVMPMYNLVEYSNNYSKTSRSLWKDYRDESSSGIGIENNNLISSVNNSKSFDYKTKIVGK